MERGEVWKEGWEEITGKLWDGDNRTVATKTDMGEFRVVSDKSW